MEGRPLPLGTWVRCDAPARIDLAGGWSDTPPICYERGGSVIAAAVLVGGDLPIGARARRIAEPVLRLRTCADPDADDGASVPGSLPGAETEGELIEIASLAELQDYSGPLAAAALPKAVLLSSGVISLAGNTGGARTPSTPRSAHNYPPQHPADIPHHIPLNHPQRIPGHTPHRIPLSNPQLAPYHAPLGSLPHPTPITLSSHLISLSSHSHPFLIPFPSHSYLTLISLASHSHPSLIPLSSHSHPTLIPLSSHSHPTHPTRIPLSSFLYLTRNPQKSKQDSSLNSSLVSTRTAPNVLLSPPLAPSAQAPPSQSSCTKAASRL